MRPTLNTWVPFFILLAVFFSFFNTFQASFQWDDENAITHNQYIKDLRNIPSFFTSIKTFSSDGEKMIYRPLRTTIRALEYRAWGLHPAGYHAVNILSHFGASFFLYRMALSLSGNIFSSLLCALFFAVAPVHTESITYISGGDDCLAGFFFLAALFLYVKNREKGEKPFRLGLGIPGLFVLALLAKEMAITFPLIVFLLDSYFFNVKDSFASRLKSTYLPLFALATIYFFARSLVVGSMTQTNYDAFGGPYSLFCTMVVGLVYYIKLLLFPINLCVDYMVFQKFSSLIHPVVLFSLSVILFFLLLIHKLKDSLPLASFGLAFFFSALLPVSQIFPVQILIAERFLYIPSAGFALFAGIILSRIWERMESRRIWGIGLLSLLLWLHGGLTFLRNGVWSSDFTLWSDAVEKYPSNPRAHSNLGTAYLKQGNWARAIMECEKGLSASLAGGRDRNNLGVIYAEMGLYEKAFELFSLEMETNASPYVRKMAEENMRKLKEKWMAEN